MDTNATVQTPITSPCIKVCTVDGASGLCLGCGRSLEEIASWVRMNEAQRQQVMDELPARMVAINEKLGAVEGNQS